MRKDDTATEEIILTVNDWVEVTDYPHMNGLLGYVEELSDNGKSYRVQIVQDKDGKPSAGLIWIPRERLIKMPLRIEKSDFNALINIALDTNDKEYFHSLVSARETL